MKLFKNSLAAFLGILYCISIVAFLLLSIPVYLFRLLVIIIAKLTRPDLGDILSGQTAIFVGDYMSETPPRSNVVAALIFEGQLTVEEVQARVTKNWIQTEEKCNFENFQRYPVKWLGFTFWKDASDTFSVSNHVFEHECSRKETEITDEQLTEIMESLLNKRTEKFQSPWTLQLISHYKNPYCTEPEENRQQHSALLFQWHHCLVDGTGAMTAVVESLFEQPWIRKSESPLSKRRGWRNILQMLSAPVSIISHFSWFLSHTFRENPFKIPESKKHWHQLCASSGLISVEHVKYIKNTLKVSYTSVLLSALSAAIHRSLGDVQARKANSMLCISTLPPRGVTKRKLLANHMSGALFELPCTKFKNPVERLRIVNELLDKSRASVIPALSQKISTLIGAHTYVVNSHLMDNKMIAVAMTNLAGVPRNIQLNKNLKWVHLKFVGGLFAGIQGASISTVSHGQQLEILLCAESALMTKEEAKIFIGHIKAEIENLRVIATETTAFDDV